MCVDIDVCERERVRVRLFVCVQVSQHRVQQDTVFFTNALRGFDGFIVSDVRLFFNGVWFDAGCRRACALTLSLSHSLSLAFLAVSCARSLSLLRAHKCTHPRTHTATSSLSLAHFLSVSLFLLRALSCFCPLAFSPSRSLARALSRSRSRARSLCRSLSRD